MRRLSHVRRSIGNAAVLVVTAFATGCERPTVELTARADAPAKAAATRVVAVKPVRATIRRTTEQPGQVEGYEVTQIHAKISGYLQSISVDIGSKMKKGDVLAVLSVPEIEAERDQKRARVDEAQAECAQAQAAIKVAQATVQSAEAKGTEVRAGLKRVDAEVVRWQSEADRTQKLVRDSAATGSLLDEMRSKLQAAEATRDELRAQIKSAEAAVVESNSGLDKSRSDLVAAQAHVDVARADVRKVDALLAYARIEAPYDGRVIKRNFDTGHLTQPGSTSEPLFVVARDDVVTVTLDVPEMFALAVDKGDPVLIRLQALAGRTFEGKVTRTTWALDPKTRTLRVEVDLPNPDGILRPGLYAYATIIVDDHADVVTLPLTAVLKEGGKASVIVVDQGRAARKAVILGINDGTQTEVRSGLDGSEVVVKTNPGSLVDGQPLEVSEIEGASSKPQ
jgi:RND family efflux transporter MFP subunit